MSGRWRRGTPDQVVNLGAVVGVPVAAAEWFAPRLQSEYCTTPDMLAVLDAFAAPRREHAIGPVLRAIGDVVHCGAHVWVPAVTAARLAPQFRNIVRGKKCPPAARATADEFTACELLLEQLGSDAFALAPVELLTAKQVAARCGGISVRAVIKALDAGRLHGRRYGYGHLVTSDEADRWQRERSA